MIDCQPPAEVCHRFFAAGSVTVCPMRSSGFSGSSLALVTGADSDPGRDRWVLKSFASSATEATALWSHRLMRHLRDSGIECVPSLRRALPTDGTDGTRVVGDTLVEDGDGVLWEAVRFMPGRAVDHPTAPQVAAAVRAIAAIHDAAGASGEGRERLEFSRGLATRVACAHHLIERPMHRRINAWSGSPLPPSGAMEAFGRAADLLEGNAASLRQLASMPRFPIPCQGVVRDLWSEHVLFEASSVSGIIDFHAAGIDTVATDLARLVGSWRTVSCEEPPRPSWDEILETYAVSRRLEPCVRSLVPLLHEAGVIVGIDNWFRWLVEEGRTFPDPHAVTRRVGSLTAALPSALGALPSAIAAVRASRGS